MNQRVDNASAASVNHFFGVDKQNTSSMAIRPLMRLMWAYKWLLVSTALLGALLGFYSSLGQVPQYRSSLTLMVTPKMPNMAMVGEGFMDPMSMMAMMGSGSLESRLLTSRAILSKAAKDLELTERTIELPPRETPVRDLFNRFGQTVVQEDIVHSVPDQTQSIRFATNGEATRYIQNNLSILDNTSDGLIDMSFQSPDAELSADILNGIAAAYIDYTVRNKSDRVTQASRWLQEQMIDIRADLERAERELQEYRSTAGATTAKSLESDAEARLLQLRATLQTARDSYQQLSQRYGPKHPKLIEARAQIARAENELSKGGTEVVSDKEKEFELARLEKEVQNAQSLHDMFLRRYQEANIATDTRMADAEVVDRAIPAVVPVFAVNSGNTITWGFAGLLLGMLVVGVRFHCDNTFKSHHEIEQKLSLPVLSVLPRVPEIERKSFELEKLYLVDQGSVYSESINRIRSSLQYSNAGAPAKIIQLTSSLEGEGKSTLAFNLALSMARMGKKTLIIDADMRRPRLHRLTDNPDAPGLSDLLKGKVRAREAVQGDRASPHLFIMHSGSKTTQPLELLGSKNFGRMFEKLSESFDHIIVDSPPILPVADALEIGRHMETVLLVIEAEKTTLDLAQDAMNQLSDAEITPTGAILSKLGARSSAYYYPQKYYRSYYAE